MKALHLAPAFLAAALASAPAAAATWLVTRFDDPAPNGCTPLDCSLREAAMAASLSPNDDTIQLASGTYVLTRSGPGDNESLYDLDLDNQSVIVQGNGSAATVIRNETPAAFDSEGRIIQSSGALLTLKGLTLEHGRVAANAIEPRGGCLYATLMISVYLDDVVMRDCETTMGGAALLGSDIVTLGDVLVEGNRAQRGAGLWLVEGVQYWTRVTVRANQATADGGGLLFSNGDSVTIHADADTQVVGNSALRGGAIAIKGDPLTSGNVYDLRGDALGAGRLSPISGNTANQGGAIYLAGGPTLLLDGFSISDNRAERGGGIDVASGTLRAFDVELVGNSATGDGGGLSLSGGSHELRRVSIAANEARGEGGGVYAGVQELVLENVSFAGNVANRGGALRSIVKPDATRLRNTSFAGNVATAGSTTAGAYVTGRMFATTSWFGDGCSGVVTSPRGNAQATGTQGCGLGAYDAGYITPAAAAVSYAWYGGQFDILGFAAGSVLKNHPKTHGASCAPHDARGAPRNDGRCDIGAYEANR